MTFLRRLLPAVALTCLVVVGSGGTADAGGSVRAYVLLPAQGRLAVVNVDRATVSGTVVVPRGDGPIAASIDGTRVLVANRERGWISEVNGITGDHVTRLSGLGHPVAIAFVPGLQGLVRPRYAVVADSIGSVDVLDLRAGSAVRRVTVAKPIAIAVENGELWVASAQQTKLSEFDISDPPRLRLIARPQAGVQLVSLAIDSTAATGVDGITRLGDIVHVDAVARTVTEIGHLQRRASQLLAGSNGDLFGAGRDGQVFRVSTTGTTATPTMRTTPGSRLTIVGGSLAATHGDSLSMFDLASSGSARSTTRLPGTASGAAFAVR
jgi:hypothetical protein